MNKNEAIEWAEKIAALLITQSDRIGNQSMGEQTLMGMASAFSAFKSGNIDALSPRIEEIILFGSVTKKVGNIGDIDLIVFDKGFYSQVLLSRDSDPLEAYYEGPCLRENLTTLCDMWFDLSLHEKQLLKKAPPVDLHVLPIAILTDKTLRRGIEQRHHDPRFFENAFSSILRFEKGSGKFIPISLTDLTNIYSNELSFCE
ncbi:hypothetical protein COB55_04535 [Candidatus Wolfebacteria bacterium]|nr:MAG: hypothetical protein COB55_04535 [Candidatus Wolfebacteria bacterium]